MQQRYYSHYFTRYLCAVMPSLTENTDVLALARNLAEELALSATGGPTHAVGPGRSSGIDIESAQMKQAVSGGLGLLHAVVGHSPGAHVTAR